MSSNRQRVAIKLTDPWKRFIYWITTECPNGEVTFTVIQGQPIKLVESRREVRFDKAGDFPLEPIES